MEKSSTEKPFLKFIAYLQIIGIILVVLGHSFHEYPDGDAHGKTFIIYRMIYSFHMPLFIFVSGYLMMLTSGFLSESPHHTIRDFIKNKFLRLILPFIVLTLVTFVPRSMMSSVADEPLELSFKSLAGSMLWYENLVIPYFWFLQASFLLLILNFIFLTGARRFRISITWMLILLFTIAIIMPCLPLTYSDIFAFDRVIDLGVYFTAGMIYCRFMTTIDARIPWTSPLFLCVTSALWVVSFIFTEDTSIEVLCALIGIAMCISLAKILVKKNITVLDHLVGANYIIFLLSWYFNVIFQQVLHHFVELPWWIYTVFSLIAGIYIPWLFYKYMQRHADSKFVKITARLLGQSLKKSQKL